MREFDFSEELKKLPDSPGVYLMHDKSDNIIYVGKAKILKNRVRQYFRQGSKHSPKIQKMVSLVAWFEYIVVDTELEALVLECNLIKEHRPRYNTMLKDDKSYPYIKVTVNEEFPRVMLAREQRKDKARYFGPYTNGVAINDTIDLLRKLYRIRTCNKNLPKEIGMGRPCLYHQIGQCDAPCVGNVSTEEYGKMVEKVLHFLNNNYSEVLEALEKKMYAASMEMEYEAAAGYRDLMNRVKALSQKQKATDTHDDERDIVALAIREEHCVVQVFFERGGKLLGREHYHMTEVRDREQGEVLGEFIKQYYAGTPYIPKEILIEAEPTEVQLLETWLSGKKGRSVHFRVPKIGGKERLIQLAKQNAELVLNQDLEKITREEKRTIGAVRELEEILGLSELHRMESYDISNISGFHSVGSMVVFVDGKARNTEYRKFRIKGVQGPNDYASMEEVLTRRFRHGEEDRAQSVENSFTRYPDLILMDGGMGQVHIAEQVLRDMGLTIPVCGMVKDDRHRTRGLYFRDQELPIAPGSEGFALLTRIQDETHRFAIEYHRSLRTKAQVHSRLDDIPGIGTARRRTLMKYYRSMEELRTAEPEELAKLPGMNIRVAQSVYDFLHDTEEPKNDVAPEEKAEI